MTWYQKVELALARMGKNQAWLAERIGKAPSRMTRWKDGTGEPGLTTALRIARVLDVPLEWLADDESDEPPPPARADDERLLLEAIRPIGVARALQILIGHGHPGAAGDGPGPKGGGKAKA